MAPAHETAQAMLFERVASARALGAIHANAGTGAASCNPSDAIARVTSRHWSASSARRVFPAFVSE
jgi:hypothetical protein